MAKRKTTTRVRNDKERTDLEKEIKSPVMVLIGSKEYKIYPQSFIKGCTFRKALELVVDNLQVSTEQIIEMSDKEDAESLDITNMLGLFSNIKQFLFKDLLSVLDAVWEYDKTLPKDEILEVALDDEVYELILGVIKLCYPLDRDLTVQDVLKNLKSLAPVKKTT